MLIGVRQREQHRSVLSLVAIALLSIGVGFGIALAPSVSPAVTITVIPILVAVLLVAWLAWAGVRERGIDVLSFPVYLSAGLLLWVSYRLWLLRAEVFQGKVTLSLARSVTVDDLVSAEVVMLLGCAAIVGGYEVCRIVGARPRDRRPVRPVRPVRLRRLEACAVWFAAIGLLSRLLFLVERGGVAAYLQGRGVGGGLGWVFILHTLTISAALLGGLLRSEGYRSRRLELLLIVTAPVVLVVNQRGGFLAFVLAYVGARWGGNGLKLRTRSVARAAVAILLVLGPILAWSSQRSVIVGQGSGTSGSIIEQATTSLGVTDQFVYQAATTGLRGDGYWGKAITSGVFVYPIPRQVWASKPKILGFGGYFTRDYYPSVIGNNTITSGYFGGWWIDFGVAGAVGGSFLFGYFLRWITVAARRGSWLGRIVFASFLAGVFQLQQGGVPEFAASFTYFGLASVVALRIARRSPPRLSAGTGV